MVNKRLLVRELGTLEGKLHHFEIAPSRKQNPRNDEDVYRHESIRMSAATFAATEWS